MSLAQRIKTCRLKAGLSQEQLSEAVGISRQAVAKWESGRSAPSTENLFKLAEIFGTTTDLLLKDDATENKPPEEEIHRRIQEKLQHSQKIRRKKVLNNLFCAIGILAGYLLIYLLGRLLYVDAHDASVIGWLWAAKPSGEHSYLYGWLLSSGLFPWCAVLSAVPALFGKLRFSLTTLIAFFLGLVAGILFGPYPQGAAYGHSHYGWAIWGVCFLLSIPLGILAELFLPRLLQRFLIKR